MPNAKVHEDEHGVFIRTGGYLFRPGGVRGYDHAYDMSDGGLKKGDTIKAAHIGGTQMARLRFEDGSKRYWTSLEPDDCNRRENIKPPTEEEKRQSEALLDRLFAGVPKRQVIR